MMSLLLNMAFKNLKMNNYLLAKAKCIFFIPIQLKLDAMQKLDAIQKLDAMQKLDAIQKLDAMHCRRLHSVDITIEIIIGFSQKIKMNFQ